MSQSVVMTSTRPYIVRAFYEWIIDNDCTPHIVVNAGFLGVEVPQEYIQNGQIILNVALSAVSAFKMSDRAIEFQARFNGRVRVVYVPYGAVLAIYAKENGRGMVFAEEAEDEGELPVVSAPQHPIMASRPSEGHHAGPGPSGHKGGPKKRPSHLTLVK